MSVNLADAPTVSLARPKPRWYQIFSWQMYDFADTIVSMNVNSRYFGLWVTQVMLAPAYVYTNTLAATMLVVALVSPILGAMSDAHQKRLPFLRFFALACALFTALIGFTGSLYIALFFYMLSNFSYNAAGGFYNALLPGLSTEKNVSTVSGIGVALGYVGAVAGILLVAPFASDNPQAAFLPTAVLFLLFAIPCLTLVPDFSRERTGRIRLNWREAYGQVADTFRSSRDYPGLFLFLIADFIYENAVAAVIALMGIYASVVVGFKDTDLDFFLIFATLFAIAGSFVYGPITDKIGPKRAVQIMLILWMVTLLGIIFFSSKSAFMVLGPLVGICLGATWISSRTYLVALSPVRKSGQFFGLYSLSGKSAGSIGPLVWGLVYALFRSQGEVAALKAAVFSLVGFIVIGFILIWKVPDVRPTKANIL